LNSDLPRERQSRRQRGRHGLSVAASCVNKALLQDFVCGEMPKWESSKKRNKNETARKNPARFLLTREFLCEKTYPAISSISS
jgi:hypothetical protein